MGSTGLLAVGAYTHMRAHSHTYSMQAELLQSPGQPRACQQCKRRELHCAVGKRKWTRLRDLAEARSYQVGPLAHANDLVR